MTTSLRGLLDWYETLTPESLETIGSYYTEDAYFKDPFNETRSRDVILRIFRDMFETLDNPSFIFDETIADARKAFITWQFSFYWRGKLMVIHGGSHLCFAEDGRVEYHRDYWDAAEELYEKIPVIGWILRRIKAKARA